MAKHIWVQMSYLVIEPALESDGSITVYTTDGHEEAAFDEAKLGCWLCFTPLNQDTINTSCTSAPPPSAA